METYSLETCSLESTEKDSVMSKLSEIEATVKQTQKEMQEFINFSQANSANQSEVQSVKSHDSSTFTDCSLTTNDSRRLMDYQVENFLQPCFLPLKCLFYPYLYHHYKSKAKNFFITY